MVNDLISDRFMAPRYAGTEASSQSDDPRAAELRIENPVCGDRLCITWRRGGPGAATARFQAWGCATSIAAGDLFCELLESRSDAELAATTPAQVAALLGEIEPAQQHCAQMLAQLLAQAQQQLLPGAQA